MNYKILLIASSLLFVGCESFVKDVFEVAATPEELAKMSEIDVCKNLGYSQWRNQPQAYLDAKNEAIKRIEAGEVSEEDCIVFAKMAIRSKQRASAQLEQIMDN